MGKQGHLKLRRALLTPKRYFIVIKIIKPETEMLLYHRSIVSRKWPCFSSEQFLVTHHFSNPLHSLLLMSLESAGQGSEDCSVQLCMPVWQVGDCLRCPGVCGHWIVMMANSQADANKWPPVTFFPSPGRYLALTCYFFKRWTSTSNQIIFLYVMKPSLKRSLLSSSLRLILPLGLT